MVGEQISLSSAIMANHVVVLGSHNLPEARVGARSRRLAPFLCRACSGKRSSAQLITI
jgi:hypothetical protein